MKYPLVIFCAWFLLPLVPCSAQLKVRPGTPHLPTCEETRNRILEYHYPDREDTLEFVDLVYEFLDGREGWNLNLPDKPRRTDLPHIVGLCWAKPCTDRGQPMYFYRGAPVNSVHSISYSRRVNYPGGYKGGWNAFRRTESSPWTVSISSLRRQVSFTRGNQHKPEETEYISLGFPIGSFSFVLEKEGVAHELNFFVPSDSEHLQQWRNQPEDVWVSAEQFRDALLAQIDAQEAIIKRDIGKLDESRDFRTVSARGADKLVVRRDKFQIRDLEYKERPPEPTIHPESSEVLKALQGELDRRRELIRREYRVLYREANRTFPLARFFQPSKTRAR